MKMENSMKAARENPTTGGYGVSKLTYCSFANSSFYLDLICCYLVASSLLVCLYLLNLLKI